MPLAVVLRDRFRLQINRKAEMKPQGRLTVVEEEGAKKKRQRESEQEQIERLRVENEQLRQKMLALKRETQKHTKSINSKANPSLAAKEKERQLKQATNRLKYVHRENEKTLKDIKRAESFKRKLETSKMTAQEHKELKESAKVAEIVDLETKKQRATSVRNMRHNTKERVAKQKEEAYEVAKMLRDKELEEKQKIAMQNTIRQERNKHLVLEVLRH